VTALFIGVVSHENSRFATSQGPDGLASRLAETLRRPGTDVTVHVNTTDLLDEATNPVTEAMVQASLTEQLLLDRRWAAYLGRSRGPAWWATHAARWARRAEQAVRSPGVGMVRRLLNIELSHFDLLRSGIEADAEWILVLEDDAASLDNHDCAEGLAALMQAAPQPSFVNVSQSFTNAELGIEHLLRLAPVGWAGTSARTILTAERPVTNTVCAILYRGSFATALLEVLESLPMEPVVPIDWKLNLALMRMFETGRLGPGDCWLVDPAPIDQLSMRSTG
jgi:hypothetical protein